jgi:sirohydrochlorin cobaltochelatase
VSLFVLLRRINATKCRIVFRQTRRSTDVVMTLEDQTELNALEQRIKILLPEQYKDTYDEVQPTSMGSAALKFAPDGKVAWDEIWGSFCDLAMAGGPPHKGKLLLPATQTEIEAQPDRYEEVVSEICRGVQLVADLAAEPSATPGWIRVECVNCATAEWLLRAITVENIAARRQNLNLELPAAPGFRLEKEIKNVITVVAKTAHYWFGHIYRDQRAQIRDLFTQMEQESPLLQPAYNADASTHETESGKTNLANQIATSTALRASAHQYKDWLGIELPTVPSAIWLMRALVASNVLSRCEDKVLFLPVDHHRDPDGEIAAQSFARLHKLAALRSIL